MFFLVIQGNIDGIHYLHPLVMSRWLLNMATDIVSFVEIVIFHSYVDTLPEGKRRFSRENQKHVANFPLTREEWWFRQTYLSC